MPFLPIAVFLVIVVGGLLILKKADSKLQPSKQKIISTPVKNDDRIHTSWGYTFPADYVFEPDVVRSRKQLLEDFKRLLTENFSDYHIYFQVPASELDRFAHPAAAPVQFIFEKDGRYLLAVFIVTKSTYRSMNVVGTQEICENMGMQCIRFYEEYANDDDYVVARIRNYLS